MRALRQYALTVLGAASMAVAFGLPHILIPRLQAPGVWYTPLTTATTYKTDETVYAAGARETSDGHWVSFDAYRYEHPRWPIPSTIGWGFANATLGVMTLVTGSVRNTFIVASFLFTFVSFLLTALLLIRWTGRPFLSAAGAAVMISAVQFVNVAALTPTSLAHMREQVAASLHLLSEFNTFARMPPIAFTFMVFVSTLWLWSEALERRTTAWVVPAGIAFGVTFYTYLFYWTTFLTSGVVLGALLLIMRRRDALAALGRILAIGLVLSIPWWISVLVTTLTFGGQEFASRAGMEFGRELNPLTWRYLLFGGGVIGWGLMDRSRLTTVLIGAIVVGGVICLNAQVVMGFNIQPGHWAVRVLDPFMIVAATYVIARVLPKWDTAKARTTLSAVRGGAAFVVASAVIAACVAYVAAANRGYSERTFRQQTIGNDSRAAYDWLEGHTRTDDVLLTMSIQNSIEVPVYTRDKVFLPIAWLTSATEDEIWDRILIACRLYGVPKSFLNARLNADNAYIAWSAKFDAAGAPDPDDYEAAFFNFAFFAVRYRFWPKYVPKNMDIPNEQRIAFEHGTSMFYFPPSLRARILNRFAQYPTDLKTLLTKYRINYLYYGPYERQIGKLIPANVPWLTKVYSNQTIEIYRVDAGAASGPILPLGREVDLVQVVKDTLLPAQPAMFDRWVGPTTSFTLPGFRNDGSRVSWKVVPMLDTKALAPAKPTVTFVNRPSPADAVTFTWPAVPRAINYNLIVWEPDQRTVGQVLARYAPFRDLRWTRSTAEDGTTSVTAHGALDSQAVVSFCRQQPAPNAWADLAVPAGAQIAVEQTWTFADDVPAAAGPRVVVRAASQGAGVAASIELDPQALYENKMSTAYCRAVEQSRRR